MSVLIGGMLAFLIPYIKDVWQADTVEAVDVKQKKIEAERMEATNKMLERLEAVQNSVKEISDGQDARDVMMYGVMDAVAANGEKTEAVAAAMAAAEQKQKSRWLGG